MTKSSRRPVPGRLRCHRGGHGDRRHRDVAQYLRAAEQERLRITHVTETHIHADLVSGSRELAARAGQHCICRTRVTSCGSTRSLATPMRCSEGWSRVRGKNQGSGRAHPRSHTEHLAFIITDTPATDRPMGVFTGDFVFAGESVVPTCSSVRRIWRGRWKSGANALQGLRSSKACPLTADLAGPRRRFSVWQIARRSPKHDTRL